MSNLLLPRQFRTRQQQLADRISATVDAYRLSVLANPVEGLCAVVAGGKMKWMSTFLSDFRGLLSGHEAAQQGEYMWAHFLEQVRRQFNAGETDPHKVAGMVLDQHSPKTPLTELELMRTLKIDSESSAESRRHFYGDATVDPNAELDRLMDRGRTVKPIEVRSEPDPAA